MIPSFQSLFIIELVVIFIIAAAVVHAILGRMIHSFCAAGLPCRSVSVAVSLAPIYFWIAIAATIIGAPVVPDLGLNKLYLFPFASLAVTGLARFLVVAEDHVHAAWSLVFWGDAAVGILVVLAVAYPQVLQKSLSTIIQVESPELQTAAQVTVVGTFFTLAFVEILSLLWRRFLR